MSGTKKHWYLKIMLAVNLFGIVSAVVTMKWDEFKDWAMERKAQKMVKVIEKGYCGEDAQCQAALASSTDQCAKSVTAKRTNKDSASFSDLDRRLAVGCLQKGFYNFNCEKKKDEKCTKRVAERYDKCYDYAYPVEEIADGIPAKMGSALTGCLYGVIFVTDETGTQGGGFSTEEVSLKRKKKKVTIKTFDGGWPSMDEVNELKEAVAEMGAQRIDNFNEAMDALNEVHGGAALDNTADVNPLDRSRESVMQSAGGSAPAERDPASETN